MPLTTAQIDALRTIRDGGSLGRDPGAILPWWTWQVTGAPSLRDAGAEVLALADERDQLLERLEAVRDILGEDAPAITDPPAVWSTRVGPFAMASKVVDAAQQTVDEHRAVKTALLDAISPTRPKAADASIPISHIVEEVLAALANTTEERNSKTLLAMLDATPIDEIESYLEDRRRDEYLSKGCADGFERTPVEIDLGEVIIPEGAWIWTDEDGAIRRAFGRLDAPLGFEGGRKLRAVTIDEYEKVLDVWRIRPVRSALNANQGSFDLNNDEHLALIRAEVLKAPITRRAV